MLGHLSPKSSLRDSEASALKQEVFLIFDLAQCTKSVTEGSFKSQIVGRIVFFRSFMILTAIRRVMNLANENTRPPWERILKGRHYS